MCGTYGPHPFWYCGSQLQAGANNGRSARACSAADWLYPAWQQMCRSCSPLAGQLSVPSMAWLRAGAAVQIQLASMTGAFQVWYSILVAVAWVPLAVLRAHDYLQGLLWSVMFSILIILGQDARGRMLWQDVRLPPKQLSDLSAQLSHALLARPSCDLALKSFHSVSCPYLRRVT